MAGGDCVQAAELAWVVIDEQHQVRAHPPAIRPHHAYKRLLGIRDCKSKWPHQCHLRLRRSFLLPAVVESDNPCTFQEGGGIQGT